ncbi:MAG: molybdenum cofactor biosynthesis protein MoaE [Thermodesulfovibrionales bacterium]
MIEKWINDVRSSAKPDDLGMILIHNGIVRGTSKDGKKVRGIHLSYDKEKLNSLITEFSKNKGILAIKVWINEGTLNIGDDIMYVLIAGRFRNDVLATFEELLSKIKREIVSEREFF